MNWKSVWNEWRWLLVAVGVCLGATLLNGGAWRAGYSAQSLGLLGCLLVRVPVLLVAWWTLVATFQAAARKEPGTGATRFTVLHLLVLVLIVPGCIGCYLAWPLVLAVLALMLVALLYSKKDALGPAWRQILLRPGMAILLFMLTWYQCASMTRQALHGLGERLDATAGSDRLMAWAAEAIAATPPGEHKTLAPDEIPDFVHDLMGRGPGFRTVGVANGPDPCVTIVTDPGFAFRITVRPSRAARDRPPWWIGEAGWVEWRPGIALDTAAK